MQKLARVDSAPMKEETTFVWFPLYISNVVLTLAIFRSRVHIPQTMTSKSIVLKNMFDPEEYVSLPLDLYRSNLLLLGKLDGTGTKNLLTM